jgi:quercetin dioxygenase-like cupin family protein
MRKHPLFVPSLFAVCAALAGAAVALASDTPPPAPEQARTFADPRLQWGPCPPFLPEGCGIAVLNGDPAKPGVDVYFKVPAGSTIAKHWHTSSERMVLVSGELRVDYDGQAPFVMTPGSYAFGPAKLPHAATCAAGDPCVLFIAFDEPLDAHAVEDAE